jgi:hypothetical protein
MEKMRINIKKWCRGDDGMRVKYATSFLNNNKKMT